MHNKFTISQYSTCQMNTTIIFTKYTEFYGNILDFKSQVLHFNNKVGQSLPLAGNTWLKVHGSLQPWSQIYTHA